MRRLAVLGVVAVVAVALAVSGCADRRAERAAQRQLGAGDTTTTTATATTTAATVATAATSTTVPGAQCSAPTSTLSSGTITVDVGGTTRESLLQLPDGFDPTRPVGVIVNFHGSGSDMTQQQVYSRLPERGAARGYLVLTPQGSGTPRGWSLAGGGTDDAFVDELLAAVRAGACPRPRIFVAGISNGSAFSALYACRHPDLVAAVGMVAATLPSLCPVDRPMPAMAFHGTDDPIVPYDGGMVNGERSGTEAPGADGAIEQWAQRNGCAEPPAETGIGGDVTRRSWTGCTRGAEVTFFSIRGGGHTWPGAIDLAKVGIDRLGATTQSVSATDRFLDFFDQVATKDG